MRLNRIELIAVISGAVLALLFLVLGGTLVWQFAREAPPARPNKKFTPLKFDLSKRVQIAHDPALQFGSGPFTISFWFRTTSRQRYMTFVCKREDTLGDGWIIHGQENNTFLFYSAGCASPTSSPQLFRDGQWHHLAFVRSGTTLTMFYDNQQVGSGPNTCNYRDTHPIRIGMDADAGWHFDGELAELHLYNRALTPAEIGEEWNGGNGRKTAVAGGGLIAGYHFDEKSGDQAIDFSGNGHQGGLIRSAVPVGERN